MLVHVDNWQLMNETPPTIGFCEANAGGAMAGGGCCAPPLGAFFPDDDDDEHCV